MGQQAKRGKSRSWRRHGDLVPRPDTPATSTTPALGDRSVTFARRAGRGQPPAQSAFAVHAAGVRLKSILNLSLAPGQAVPNLRSPTSSAFGCRHRLDEIEAYRVFAVAGKSHRLRYVQMNRGLLLAIQHDSNGAYLFAQRVLAYLDHLAA